MAAKPFVAVSPTILVRADVSIREAIKMMKERGVGSVLVISDTNEGKLEGIFTERDLLKKFDTIIAKDHLERPVRTVMTSKIVTLPVTQMDDAAAIMIEKGIRHLPIVDSTPGNRVIGVLSMRDLFQSFVEAAISRKSKVSTGPALNLTLVAEGPRFVQLFGQSIAALPKIAIRHLRPSDILPIAKHLEDLTESKVLLIDIDDLKPPEWSELLKALSKSKVFAIAVYDPIAHPRNILEVLMKLRRTEHFAIFPKPISIGTLQKVIISHLT